MTCICTTADRAAGLILTGLVGAPLCSIQLACSLRPTMSSVWQTTAARIGHIPNPSLPLDRWIASASSACSGCGHYIRREGFTDFPGQWGSKEAHSHSRLPRGLWEHGMRLQVAYHPYIRRQRIQALDSAGAPAHPAHRRGAVQKVLARCRNDLSLECETYMHTSSTTHGGKIAYASQWP